MNQNGEPPRPTHARDGVLILIALLGVAGSFGSQRGHWWFPYVAGTFFTVGVAVLLQGFAWPWLAARARLRTRRRYLNRAARELWPSFAKLVNQFGLLVDADAANSGVRYFWELGAHNPALRAKLPAVIPPWYFKEFFGLVRRRLDNWDGTYETMKDIGHGFTIVVMQYEQVYVRPMLDAFRRMPAGELTDDIRRKVNLIREEYVAFVRDFRASGRAANSRCGEQAFAEYLEVPEAI